MKPSVKLVVDIYEPEGGYYQAHLGTDEFLRGCVRAQRWQRVRCTAEIYWAPA